MEIKVWRDYSKKSNSTAVPSGLPSATYEVTIPSEINPLSPAIIFDGYKKFNYAYIPDFSRYYFVSSLTYGTGHTFAVLELDIGASYAAAIKSYEAYVLRSASRYDGNITDNMYPVIGQGKLLPTRAANPFQATGTHYMVQYVGKSGVESVLLTTSGFRELCAQLWQGWENLAVGDAVVSAVFDPFQYVQGVWKTPTGEDFWKTTENVSMTLGTINTGVSGAKLTHNGTVSFSIPIPKHPGSTERPYLKNNPYSQYTLKLPGAGWVALPAQLLYGAATLSITLRAEPIEGKALYELTTAAGTVANIVCNVAIPWGITKSELNNVSNIAGNAGNILVGAFTNPIATAAGVVSAATDMGTTVTRTGAPTGALDLRDEIILQLEYHDTTPEDISRNGRPLMQVVRLGDLTGYTLCGGSHFAGAQTETENNMVNAFLDGGFYNE